jgi:AAA domain, putative AbiEii toxin, Type IV TA system
MATDLETATDQGERALGRPSLKIVGLHIRGLKSITSLDLPEDGLGWDGPIPDMVMVGGINGSGKTTLLEFLANSFILLGRLDAPPEIVPPILRAVEARIDLRISIPELPDASVRFLVGDERFMVSNARDTWFGFIYSSPESELAWVHSSGMTYQVACLQELARSSGDGDLPGVVYFPSEGRTLISPETNYKFAGKTMQIESFIFQWKPPARWNDSLESRLYGVRWEDLNAKEEGREREANGFAAYSKAFDRFFEGRKRLKWDHGELVVETKSGAIHDLSELSSGEKQVILFMGELLHRWRPGSLILIDEPELHLHESYQTKLWESLVHWQKERGGQVIVSTQSGHLFRIASSAMKVLLSRQSR